MKSCKYGNVILITGASSGLGRAAALEFAGKGFQVLACSRHPGEAVEHVGAGCIHPVKLDVCDSAQVDATIGTLLQQYDIGLVLHCAGFGIGGAADDSPVEAVQKQFDTNFFGVLRLNRALLPHFRARGRGLVLLTGSVAGLIPIPFQSAYSASKYALEAYGETLRMESRGFGIDVCLLEPGDTKTGFTGSRTLVLPEGSPYTQACTRSIEKMARDEQSGAPPENFARIACRVAFRRSPPVRKVVGLGYKTLTILKPLLPARFAQWVLSMLYVPKG